MSDVLISIRPIFADRIKEGRKTVEIRKKFSKYKNKWFYIYESKPVQKITARFRVEKISTSTPELIWEETAVKNGLDLYEFYNYTNRLQISEVTAVYITDLEVFKEPIDPYKLIDNFRPPVNYMKFNSKLLERVKA